MCFDLYEYLTPGVIKKFRPYRNVFTAISIIAIFFAVLIIVENIIFLSIASRQSVLLLLLPYLLSWVLILLGYCFGRFAFILHSRDMKRFSSVIPLSSVAWGEENSRPVTPSPTPSFNETHLGFNPTSTLVYRNSLTVPPSSPFFISDTVNCYRDEPPSYSEIVDRGIPPKSPNSIMKTELDQEN